MSPSPLKRRPDWRPRLVRYVASIAGRPFVPGQHDCALFAAGAVAAQTGVDLATHWLGYASLREGLVRLKANGFADHVALAAHHLPEVRPAFGRVGDIAVLSAAAAGTPGSMDALGVVQGRAVYVLRPGQGGLGLVPLTEAKRMLRVG